MSGPRATWKPPPKATPCTAAITGTGTSRQTQAAYCARLATPWLRAPRPASLTVERPRGPSAIWPKLPMSSPAQKARPSPLSTTARTPFSVFSRSPAPTRASNMALSSAFILSTRTMRTSATPSSMLIVTRSFMACSSCVSPRCAADVGEGKRRLLPSGVPRPSGSSHATSPHSAGEGRSRSSPRERGEVSMARERQRPRRDDGGTLDVAGEQRGDVEAGSRQGRGDVLGGLADSDRIGLAAGRDVFGQRFQGLQRADEILGMDPGVALRFVAQALHLIGDRFNARVQLERGDCHLTTPIAVSPGRFPRRDVRVWCLPVPCRLRPRVRPSRTEPWTCCSRDTPSRRGYPPSASRAGSLPPACPRPRRRQTRRCRTERS